MTQSHRHNLLVLAAAIVTFLTAVLPSEALQAALCSNSYTPGLTALPDLGFGTYQGQQGGLYPNGQNALPAGHSSLGLELSAQVQPRSATGAFSSSGKIGLIAIGVSNTSDDFLAFVDLANSDPRLAANVVMVDGGVSGRPIDFWLDPADSPWGDIDQRVAQAGLTDQQVQVAWIMLPDRDPLAGPFPSEQLTYRDKLETVLRNLKARFPHLVISYLSSHSYTGYGVDHPNIEPFGYEHGFGVKWVIEDQINGAGNINSDSGAGPVTAPWVAWGPYMWANGLGPDETVGGQAGRADGLEWLCSDFESDGIHPSTTGREKAATLLLAHFTTDPTACSWFVETGACSAGTTGFVDIASSPFAADILWLAQQGITNGCKPPPDALFCPQAAVTRGEMAAFLVRAFGFENARGLDHFTDDEGSVFEDDINKLASAGVTTGCKAPPNAQFCPAGQMTRGEMAAFLSRALGLSNSSPTDLFGDDNDSVFELDIERIALAGITTGCQGPPDSLFCPLSFVTREQMAAFLHRALG